MIITTIQACGRETVLEYSSGASWLSWGIEREGEWDTHVFLGKFSLVKTNHWQSRPHLATKVAGIAVVMLALCGVADATGFMPYETWGWTGPR